MNNVVRHKDVHKNKTFVYFEDKSIRVAFGKGGDAIDVFKEKDRYDVMHHGNKLCELKYSGGKPKINDEREIWPEQQALQPITA